MFISRINFPSGYNRIRVGRSLVFCVMFCRSLFIPLSFGHFIVCPSSIYGFWLPLWYFKLFVSRWNEVDLTLATCTKVMQFELLYCNWEKCLFARNIYCQTCPYGHRYLCNQCLSPLMLGVRISIRARCTTLCDKVCQWLATGRRFSPGPPVSSRSRPRRPQPDLIVVESSDSYNKLTGETSGHRLSSDFSFEYGLPITIREHEQYDES
jgi:hypothetical protein